MSFIETRKRSTQFVWIFLFYAVIAAALIAPIASQTDIPSMADFINHLAEIIQAKMALSSGQFPLRIAPLWAYPIYQFYSPTTYLVAGLIYWFLTPSNPLIAYQLITWMSLILGGVYLSRVAYWFTGVRIAALLAGVVYMTAPYNIIVHFRIGDLNEGVALGVLPIVLFYTLVYFYRPLDHKNLVKMVLAYYVLITTHLVTSIYFTLFVGLLLLCIALKNKRYFSHLTSVVVGYIWSGLLACWFLAPVIFFQKYLYVSDTYNTTDYLKRFTPSLWNLFSMTALVTKGSASAVATLHPALGWPILLGVGVSCYAFLNHQKSKNKRADYWLPALLVVFLVTFFCSWSPINFWQWLPTDLRIAQYSWRLLGQVMWLGAILFAWSIAWIFKNQLDKRHMLIGAFLIMMSISPWIISVSTFKISLAEFKQHPFLVYNNNAYLLNFDEHTNFVSQINMIQLNVSNFSNFNSPITIPYPLLKIATKPNILIEGNISTAIAPKHYNWIAIANHQQIAKGSVEIGKFHWRIPLPSYDQLPPTEKLLSVQFILQKDGKKVSEWFKNPIEVASLYGFTNASTIISLKEMQKLCHQKGDRTICDVFAPSKITAVELPVYYYPKLYDIRINGQPVSYRGILDGTSLLAGVTPITDSENRISIHFSGLHWANLTSLIAWSAWLFYCVFITVGRKKSE